jgi:hypothetical protein
MAAFSKKMMGKEVGNANVYAKPHTMSGKVVKATTNPGKEPNHSRVDTVDMSVGTFSNKPDGMGAKTSGLKPVVMVAPPKGPWPEAQWRKYELHRAQREHCPHL